MLTHNRQPILTSLLDVDFYKFTMGQFIFHRHPGVDVAFELTNRTKSVALAEFISEDDLRFELDAVRKLRFNKTELHYLRGTNEYTERMFKEDYLDFLGGLKLPDYTLTTGSDGQYSLRFPGTWAESTYWETIALCVVNELYYRTLMSRLSSFEQDVAYAQGRVKLAEKIRKLKAYPGLRFTDFGTRRRFSLEWQRYVNRAMAAELPGKFLGTSDTLVAMEQGLLPMGTNAHELPMVYAALTNNNYQLSQSPLLLLDDWWDEYGWALSIVLPDTFGSEFIFQNMGAERAAKWKGFRHDSNDAIAFGERVIRFYQDHGIDPREKMVIFSDGLEVDQIISLYEHFNGRIIVTFGWGTTLTNDLIFKNLSLVVKAAAANGRRTVKLSDNMAKAMGPTTEVDRYKTVFGHTVETYEECKV